jgi:hypothetical protein
VSWQRFVMKKCKRKLVVPASDFIEKRVYIDKHQ